MLWKSAPLTHINFSGMIGSKPTLWCQVFVLISFQHTKTIDAQQRLSSKKSGWKNKSTYCRKERSMNESSFERLWVCLS